MDRSETYIKMCEKARKFLPEWIPQEGDPFCCRGEVYIYQDLYMGSEKNEDCFPLYRQDQLQEMVDLPLVAKIENFAKYASDTLDPYFAEDRQEFTSMEQLWLAFAMKEKYKKVWNGEEWIAI